MGFLYGGKYPPEDRAGALDMFREMDAWRSGDPELLSEYYPRYVTSQSQAVRGVFRSKRYINRYRGARFNVAAMVSNYMGDLMFGQEPRMLVGSEPGRSEELNMFLGDRGVWAKCREAAAMASLYGGVYLVPEWDANIGEVALTAVPPAEVFPYFWQDRLVGGTVVSVISVDGDVLLRHFREYRKDGSGPVVVHSLWRGSDTALGEPVPAEDLVFMLGVVGEPVPLETEDGMLEGAALMSPMPGDRIMLEYVPNKRPSVLSPEGESDLYGVRSAMFRLDQIASSWERDFRLGKMRVALPGGIGKGGGSKDDDGVDRFDEEQELWYKIPVMTGSRDSGLPVEQIEFRLRSEEHRIGLMSVLEEIAGGTGLSPQQLGIRVEAPAETGAALKRRKERTLETQMMKRRYWGAPLVRSVENLLLAAQEANVAGAPPVVRPILEWAPAVEPSFEEMAQAVFSLSQSAAISTEGKVRMLHPDWTEDQIGEEVAKIETSAAVAQGENRTNMSVGDGTNRNESETDEG